MFPASGALNVLLTRRSHFGYSVKAVFHRSAPCMVRTILVSRNLQSPPHHGPPHQARHLRAVSWAVKGGHNDIRIVCLFGDCREAI